MFFLFIKWINDLSISYLINDDGSELNIRSQEENELFDYIDQNNKCFQMLFTEGDSEGS